MRIVSRLFDLLFPPRQSEILIRSVETLPYTPALYKDTSYLSWFSEATVSATITENKYHNNKYAAGLLAKLLLEWYKRQDASIVFMPIPLSTPRQRERGYNQVTRVLQSAVELNPTIRILDTVLKRKKHTLPQTSLKRAERTQNVKQAFSIADSTPLQQLDSVTLVLIDDVVTTGSTLDAAEAVLRPHLPTNVHCIKLALAH
jgi:ComF family protein